VASSAAVRAGRAPTDIGFSRRSGGDGRGPNEGTDLALSLTLQNAQMLGVAAEKGRLSVALRSPEDNRVQDGLGEVASDTFLQKVNKPAGPSGPALPVPVQSAGGR